MSASTSTLSHVLKYMARMPHLLGVATAILLLGGCATTDETPTKGKAKEYRNNQYNKSNQNRGMNNNNSRNPFGNQGNRNPR